MSKSLFRRYTKKILLFTNFILAAVFLLGCYGYYFNPIYFWPVGLLTLSSFYLFLGLLVFIVFWLILKPRWSLISIIAIAISFKSLTQIFPLHIPRPFALQKPVNSLRLMSWNVAQFDVLGIKKHPEVKNQMIDLVNEYSPDIACFQEMVCEDSTVIRHGHVTEFQQRLNFPQYFYAYNRKEDFWDYAHFGIIIFSKYPIINRQIKMWYPYDYNSIFQYADIVKGADTIRVFNIHLQSLRFSRENLKYIDQPSVEDSNALAESKSILSKFRKGFLKRKAQADRIREEMEKSPYRVIVCGDFNDVPNSYAYHTIGEGLRNAFVEGGLGLGRTFSGIAPTLRIDNIFTDRKLEVEQYECVRKKLSDHFPVIADIIINSK